LHGLDQAGRGVRLEAGGARAEDGALAFGVREGDPVVEAAALERVVQLARAVGGEHDDRRRGRGERAELGDGDLEVAEELQQERLELAVRTVDLVDQQDGAAGGADRPQQRAFQQEPLVVQVADVRTAALRDPDLEELPGVVPTRTAPAQASRPSKHCSRTRSRPQHLRQRRRHLGLPDSGLTLEQQRAGPAAAASWTAVHRPSSAK
jgi:hypothetical protein